jgi:hypothetical protein
LAASAGTPVVSGRSRVDSGFARNAESLHDDPEIMFLPMVCRRSLAEVEVRVGRQISVPSIDDTTPAGSATLSPYMNNPG